MLKTLTKTHFLNSLFNTSIETWRKSPGAILPGVITAVFLLLPMDVLAVDRTWSGLGGTNNWSEAANWSDNSVPGVNDRAIFNGTSTKNATINTNINVQGILIEAAYTGTISQGASNLIVGTGNYSQTGGTFTAGSGVLDFNGAFTLSDGTFTAPAGPATFAGDFTVSGAGVFAPNGGTVVFDAGQAFLTLPASLTLANLSIHKFNTNAVIFLTNSTIVVTGALSLSDGAISNIGANGTIDAQGAVNIASTFDGGNATLLVSGTAARTVTLPVGAALPRLVVNAPFVTMDTSGAGTITFVREIVVQNVLSFTNGAVNLTFSTFTQTGGTFTAGSGVLDFNGAFTLSGGTFTAPAGPVMFASNFTVSETGVFAPNGGTVVFDAGQTILNLPASFTLANLTINKTGGSTVFFDTNTTIIVTDELSLTDGFVSNNNGQGTIEAQGAVNIASTFDGGTATLLISGNAARTVTLPVGGVLPRLVVNAPNVTMNTSGAGTITFAREIVVPSVLSFTNGAVNFVFSVGFTVGAGANFVPGSGNLTFNSTFTQTGGTFTAGSGVLDFNGAFTLNGGTFTAPAGPVTFASNFTVSGTGVFAANGGTAVFDAGQTILNLPASFTLANLTINKTGGSTVFFGTNTTIIVMGALSLTDGAISNDNGLGTIEAQGAVTIASTFDGGTANFRFGGTAGQAYANAGGVNLTGTWTIDKSAGTVNLGSDLNISNGTSVFNLVNGTITTGAFVVNAGTRSITRTTGYISGNLQRRFTSTGARSFDVGTENGYSPVGVNVTSVVNPSELLIGAVQGAHPNAPNPLSALGRYWSLTETGDLTATLVFNYLQADVPAVAEDTLELRRYTGTGTIFDLIPSTVDTTANTATTTSGITDFSDWTLLAPSGPTSAPVSVGGRVVTDSGRGIPNTSLTMTDMKGASRKALTNPFGYYRFDSVSSGQTYVVSVWHKSYEFANPTQTVTVMDSIADIDFTALNPKSTGGKGSITGRVFDENNNGIEGVEIEVLGGEMTEPRTVITGKNGEYEIDGVKIGGTFILSARSKHLVFSVPTTVVVLEEDSARVDFDIIVGIYP